MLRPLSTIDRRDLQSIHAQLRSGDAAGALACFDALPPHSREHPDGLFLHALALQALSRFTDARVTYEQALALAPDHAGLWNSYGNLLDDLGEGSAAVEALQKAVALNPDSNDFLVNLGIVATNAGRFDVAEAVLGKAIRAAPGTARGWSALALLERKRGNAEVSAKVYQRAIEADPEDVRNRHNLAMLLRENDRLDEALTILDDALRIGPVPPETATLRAHLLADVARFDESASEYLSIARQVPDYLEAHEAATQLQPQIGREAEALDSYRAALRARPDSAALWKSALRSAFDVRDFVQLADWSRQAETALGPDPEVRVMHAAALSRLGDQPRAIDLLRAIVAERPDDAAAHQHLAHSLTVAGDFRAAEGHALRASEIDPLDQSSWAMLTAIWRALDDPREAWLADYERLIMPVDLDAAPGFFDELAARLTEWHIMREHPADQSLRGGTQTRGNLFDRRDPLIVRLIGQIRAGVQQRLRALPDDPAHPFLSRKGRDLDFVGAWSVRLRSEGFHISHMHPRGWMSSALYASLPPEVGQGDAGALAFGVPDAALGLDLPPRRIEKPQVGRLIVFPSYFWHGTLPFQSAQPRLTVAFDALPVDSATRRS